MLRVNKSRRHGRTLYRFQRGAATFVEVLSAQQTDDDAYISD
jgi:hypothetical protein